MSIFDISSELAIGILVGIFLTILLTVSFYFVKNKIQNKFKQTAIATGSARLSQAGRDVVDIGSYSHTQTTLTQGEVAFLPNGEEIVTASSKEELAAQVSELWSGATKYVYGVSLYGAPFMPPAPELESLLRKGVEVRMVLVDPDCKAAEEIAKQKCRFSATIQHYQVLAETLRINTLEPPEVLNRIREEVNATIELKRSIKKKYPAAKFTIKEIDFLPTWKGTVVDGEKGVYVIYDVPRLDVPFRFSQRRDLLEFYLNRYFSNFWNSGREVD